MDAVEGRSPKNVSTALLLQFFFIVGENLTYKDYMRISNKYLQAFMFLKFKLKETQIKNLLL